MISLRELGRRIACMSWKRGRATTRQGKCRRPWRGTLWPHQLEKSRRLPRGRLSVSDVLVDEPTKLLRHAAAVGLSDALEGVQSLPLDPHAGDGDLCGLDDVALRAHFA